MITFETQEEFENAVMEVLQQRLLIGVQVYGDEVRVVLKDKDNAVITWDADKY